MKTEGEKTSATMLPERKRNIAMWRSKSQRYQVGTSVTMKQKKNETQEENKGAFKANEPKIMRYSEKRSKISLSEKFCGKLGSPTWAEECLECADEDIRRQEYEGNERMKGKQQSDLA